MVFVGDLVQLPPVGVGCASSFVRRRYHRPWVAGLAGLSIAVELSQIMRQLAPAQAAFREMLLSAAEGAQDERDWANFHPTSRATFDGVIHIFATNGEVDHRNWPNMQIAARPITEIDADHYVGGCHR